MDNYYSTVNIVKTGSYYDDYLVNRFVGFYSIHYNATDGSGNKADELIRYVNVVDCGLSIQDGSLSQFVKIYPNPNIGKFVLEINLTDPQLFDVVITNSLGQVVKTMARISADKVNIDLGEAASGVYSVRIQTATETVVKQVTVTR